MKNIIFYDYGNGCADLIIDYLYKQGIADTKIWIDNKELFMTNCKNNKRHPLRMPDYDWFDLREGYIDYRYEPYREISDKMQEHFNSFIKYASREDIKAYATLWHHKNNHIYGNSSIYALKNIYSMLVVFFYNMLKKHNIDMVIFKDMPHEGADTVLHKLCQLLNIPFVLLEKNAIFPSKFFAYTSTDDYAKFNKLPQLEEPKAFHIKNTKAQKSYADISQATEININTVPDFTRLFYLNSISGKLFRFKKIKNAINFFKQPMENKLHKLEINLSNTIMYLNYLKFIKNKKDIECKNFDIDNTKFVFFPMHYQPEVTTIGLGGIFSDQILAIEKLSELIPNNWKIYVKEHYTQSIFMRDPVFYSRLKGIKNVCYLPLSVSSYKLIDKSQFVSTITGTAGYEAVCANKKVLIFGAAWYRDLPGVFEYSDDIKIEDILAYKFTKENVENKISEICSKMYNGVLDSDFYTLIKDNEKPDIYKNAKMVARVIGEIIIKKTSSATPENIQTLAL